MTADTSNPLPLPSALRRKARPLDGEPGERRSHLPSLPDFLRTVEPDEDGISLIEFSRSRLRPIEGDLLKYGAILFRGFAIGSPDEFAAWMKDVCGPPLPYDERSSPRQAVTSGVYTSTEYTAARRIAFHNESSYRNSFPGKIAFWCMRPAETGGETPIAHTGRVLARLPEEVRDAFRTRGWSCVRNYRPGLGMSWQESFQTDDRRRVQEHCEREGLVMEWLGENHLRTTAVRDAIACRPQTHEESWFNHAAFFHISTLDLDLREALEAQFAPRDLPANTFYGDGEPIPDDVVTTVRAAYEAESAVFAWRSGDVLLLDNVMVAHARSTFTGERRVLVAMAEPLTADMVKAR
ncbi:TauD/TfdA family dioxygenase [Sinorhizobium meliloti]|uniref:TauD/TfdA family dioxygenase n=1 Tax=Rhizobium meliloti TaxID=382 RepID=UPI000FDC0105|nr:TauD/TfdA family dioxygenase [Sinorhizobium meliloti]RVK17008.1 TauD/TfdA family dioxygenase [Sinorhizobium meliloti]